MPLQSPQASRAISHVCIGDVGEKGGNTFFSCGETVMPEYISFFIHYTSSDGILMDIQSTIQVLHVFHLSA